MTLTNQDYQEIMKEVKANLTKLEECPGPHQFEGPLDKDLSFNKYRCKRCGGVIDGINQLWYQRGLKHGIQSAGGGGK